MKKKIIIDAFEKVACPHCQNEFTLQDAITSQTVERYEDEYEAMLEKERSDLRKRLTSEAEKSAAKRFEEQIAELNETLQEARSSEERAKKQIEVVSRQAAEVARKEFIDEAELLKADLAAKDERLAFYRESEMELRKEKAALEEKQKELSLEVERKVDLERKKIEESSAETYRLREAEWRKKIDDAQRANDDLKRKLEQGSQQLQGEVLELEIEKLLENAFPLDEINPVRKGVRGADVHQTVRLRSGAKCGAIVWESKRAENWSNSWIPKLKVDQQAVGAELAVLVSTIFPSGVNDPMVLHDGVWLVRPDLVKPIAETLRMVLIESYKQKVIASGKGEAMEALYDYICSPQFAQNIRAVVDAYQQMRDDLEKEKAAMHRLWKKREGQLERITLNVMGMCGDIQGISSEPMPQLEDLGVLIAE